MKVDFDGLDGVLLVSVSPQAPSAGVRRSPAPPEIASGKGRTLMSMPQRRPAPPLPIPQSKQRTEGSVAPRRLQPGRSLPPRQGMTLVSIPPRRPKTPAPSPKETSRREEVRQSVQSVLEMSTSMPPASVILSDDELPVSSTPPTSAVEIDTGIARSSNLGATQKGRPPVIVEALGTAAPTEIETAGDNRMPPFETLDMDTDTDESGTPSRPQRARRPRTRGIRVAASFLLVGGIACAAAYLGGVFRMIPQKADIVAAEPHPSSIAAGPPTAMDAPPVEAEPAEASDDVAPAVMDVEPIEPADEEMSAPSSVDGLRFPGEYLKGDINPQIQVWHKVDKFFQQFRDCRGQIRIVGYTCSLGDGATNEYVSRRRAKVVAKYFVERGYDKSRLVVEGMGASMPIGDNETEEGRILNRRVEISCR